MSYKYFKRIIVSDRAIIYRTDDYEIFEILNEGGDWIHSTFCLTGISEGEVKREVNARKMIIELNR